MNLQQTIEAIRAKVEALPLSVPDRVSEAENAITTYMKPNQARADALKLCRRPYWFRHSDMEEGKPPDGYLTIKMDYLLSEWPPSMRDALIETWCQQVAKALGWSIKEIGHEDWRVQHWYVYNGGTTVVWDELTPIEALCAALGVEVAA